MTDNQALMQEAVSAYQHGALRQADEVCARILSHAPQHVDALHLRGVIALHDKAFARARDYISAALAIRADSPSAQNNLGMALVELGRPSEALEHFDSALRLKPAFAGAHNSRGIALRALSRHDAALASFDAALAIKPAYAEAWYNRALTAHDLKQHAMAAENCARALSILPTYAEAWNLRGLALQEMGRTDDALESYRRALNINPALAEAHNNRGVALQSARRYAQALESYDAAIALDPLAARTWSNRGAALDHLHRYDEALGSYDRAVALDPTFVNAWNNRGVALAAAGRRLEAITSYDQAIAADADNADAHWNKSICHLQLGDFSAGWALHEWRWKSSEIKLEHRHFLQPLWLGAEPVAGKTVLLHADQGFGDAIQFCRYARLAAERGARVVLEVRKPLVPLMQGLRGVAAVVTYGEALPPFDMHCPLGSLPCAFHTDLTNIPNPEGYLRADTAKLNFWRSRLSARVKPRVGLAWSGNTQHKNDHNRSIALKDLCAALPAGLEYLVLQKDVTAAEREVLDARGEIRHFSADISDFSDTAALCALVDIVISVDTSVAHLAGALARPVWIMLPFNPDWRWLLERRDSPWYATARLYRQPRPGDWASVLAEVSTDLARR